MEFEEHSRLLRTFLQTQAVNTSQTFRQTVMNLSFRRQQTMAQSQDPLRTPPKLARRKACCKLFELQLGVIAIVVLDFMLLLFLFSTERISQFDIILDSFTEDVEGMQKKYATRSSYFRFQLVTNYIIISLLIVKLVMGLKYVWFLAFPLKMNHRLLLNPLREEMHQVSLLSRDRGLLEQYYAWSIAFKYFMVIQGLALIIVFFGNEKLFYKYVIILSCFPLSFLLEGVIEQKITEDSSDIQIWQEWLFKHPDNEENINRRRQEQLEQFEQEVPVSLRERRDDEDQEDFFSRLTRRDPQSSLARSTTRRISIDAPDLPLEEAKAESSDSLDLFDKREVTISIME